MKLDHLIDSMQRFAVALPALVSSFGNDDVAAWRPDDGAWSVLEIVTHLADEESLDFRTRVFMTLETPEQDWPPIDPEGWVTERRYNDGKLTDVLDRFLRERRDSIARLRALSNPDWSTTNTHPKFGSMTAGNVMTSWAAHDQLHLRQLAKRLHQLIVKNAAGYTAEYAGPIP